ncbi:hypothetical protein NKJ26_33115, partial [Mesorhizobium sp. M0152]|uniref:hypothetical protein n=1 Tax=Mesorhizobium sp. M0152 TaxID=2956898 RepID=UPI00333AF3E6
MQKIALMASAQPGTTFETSLVRRQELASDICIVGEIAIIGSKKESSMSGEAASGERGRIQG